MEEEQTNPSIPKITAIHMTVEKADKKLLCEETPFRNICPYIKLNSVPPIVVPAIIPIFRNVATTPDATP
jgi:hypothetical protein